MDLSKLIANACSSRSCETTSKPAGKAPKCECGHELSEHVDGESCEQCGCSLFVASSEIVQQVNEPSEPKVNKVNEGSEMAAPAKPFMVPPSVAVAPEEEPESVDLSRSVTDTRQMLPDEDVAGKGLCAHLCSCGKFWSHGDIAKCRYPDVLKQGRCPVCLDGSPTDFRPEDDIEEGKNGDIKLTVAASIRIRNEERVMCGKMNPAQLTLHIQYLSKLIEELRVRAIETSKMRREKEEDELVDIPESDREKFRQALRAGASSAPAKTPRVKKSDTPEARLSKQERHIQSLMKTLGKTREQVEAFLND